MTTSAQGPTHQALSPPRLVLVRDSAARLASFHIEGSSPMYLRRPCHSAANGDSDYSINLLQGEAALHVLNSLYDIHMQVSSFTHAYARRYKSSTVK